MCVTPPRQYQKVSQAISFLESERASADGDMLRVALDPALRDVLNFASLPHSIAGWFGVGFAPVLECNAEFLSVTSHWANPEWSTQSVHNQQELTGLALKVSCVVPSLSMCHCQSNSSVCIPITRQQLSTISMLGKTHKVTSGFQSKPELSFLVIHQVSPELPSIIRSVRVPLCFTVHLIFAVATQRALPTEVALRLCAFSATHRKIPVPGLVSLPVAIRTEPPFTVPPSELLSIETGISS